MERKYGIIVIGGHVQALGIVRIYGDKGIPCVVLDSEKRNIARHSKYCTEFVHYKEEELLESLMAMGDSCKYKDWLIIPTSDLQVRTVSENKSQLEQYFKVSTDSWENVEVFFNKTFTYKMACELSIDIPMTWFPQSLEDVKKKAYVFPCIIKPAVVQDFYRETHKKVFFCQNRDELISNYVKSLEIIPKDEIIIQDIIPGSSENQYSACFTYDKTRPIVQMVARRKRQHPIDFGNATTFAETVDNTHLIPIARKLLDRIGYKGICEVEFKYDIRDNKFKLLEVNPRTWKWHSIAEKSGSPFLLSLYDLLYTGSSTQTLTWGKASFKHIITDVPTSLNLLFKGKLKFGKNGNTHYAVWNIADIKPSIYELLYLYHNIKNR